MREEIVLLTKNEEKPEKGQCLRSSSPMVKPLLFHVLMDASTLIEKKLRIPKKFVKNYGDKLGAFATLVVPSGDDWLVRLTVLEDKLWFTDGWHEFVVRYSICVGSLLVFKYVKDSIFKVSIFNLKSYEVDYIEKPKAAGEEKQFSASHGKGIESKDADKCRIRPQSTRDVGVQVNGSEIDRAQLKKQADIKQTIKRKQRNEPSNLVKEMEKPSRKLSRMGSDVSHVSAPERERTIQSAEKFKPSNPHCRIVMRRSFLSNSCLHIPNKFSSKYLSEVSEPVTLEDSNGKQWPVKCIIHRQSRKLSQGWSQFVRDNRLKEGDVCVFELKEKKKVLLHVTIFRVSSHLVTSETKPQSEVQA